MHMPLPLKLLIPDNSGLLLLAYLTCICLTYGLLPSTAARYVSPSPPRVLSCMTRPPGIEARRYIEACLLHACWPPLLPAAPLAHKNVTGMALNLY